MERSGRLTALITQNVDGLHEAAGSRQVVDLHGRISAVICLDCRERTDRLRLHQRLDAANPGFGQGISPDIAPDGDAVVDGIETFVVVPCESCGGVLKPDVVFFGENVPKERVELCYSLVEEAEALLVAGSSLTVMSGLRFVRAAQPARHPDRDRQPRPDPRRRAGDAAGRCRVLRGADRPRRCLKPTRPSGDGHDRSRPPSPAG